MVKIKYLDEFQVCSHFVSFPLEKVKTNDFKFARHQMFYLQNGIRFAI